MAVILPRQMDFWRVNSYGYPNPLIDDHKSQEAWTTFRSFFDYTSYSELKDYWASSKAPRRLHPHAVESWKSTFEEFGLLFVISRSDTIQITPAGIQYRDAGENRDESLLAWIGLTLLLRYPLRGPRRPKSDAHSDSDLLVYRFLFGAMHDLHGYFWWTELERILCRVFHTQQVNQAIEDVQLIRSTPSEIDKFPLPVIKRPGAFYNSLNQVVVHASMNHMLFDRQTDSTHYRDDEPKRRHSLTRRWLPLVRDALNLIEMPSECGDSTTVVSRLPQAPSIQDEEGYFAYLGASVSDRTMLTSGRSLPTVSVDGDPVMVLKEEDHYERVSDVAIQGLIATLCVLSVGQRVALSSDELWTYIVQEKRLNSDGSLTVSLRRARPITNSARFKAILGDKDV